MSLCQIVLVIKNSIKLTSFLDCRLSSTILFFKKSKGEIIMNKKLMKAILAVATSVMIVAP